LRIISLLTDFGLTDPFVAEMKVVILSICPEVQIIDLSHGVEKFDIRMGAFLLATAAPYFPQGTIHVGVVDPGVGSERRPIIVQTSKSIYVGPDNGLLVPAARSEGIRHVYHVTNKSLMRREISATFHARDIFAPTAAHLASGFPPADSGDEIIDYVSPSFAQAIVKKSSAVAEVFHIDGFGNVVTNISQAQVAEMGFELGQKVTVVLGRRGFLAKFASTYSDLKSDELGVLVGSHGFLEIACCEKGAAKKIRARRGSLLRLSVA